jgi:hypothetical protein
MFLWSVFFKCIFPRVPLEAECRRREVPFRSIGDATGSITLQISSSRCDFPSRPFQGLKISVCWQSYWIQVRFVAFRTSSIGRCHHAEAVERTVTTFHKAQQRDERVTCLGAGHPDSVRLAVRLRLCVSACYLSFSPGIYGEIAVIFYCSVVWIVKYKMFALYLYSFIIHLLYTSNIMFTEENWCPVFTKEQLALLFLVLRIWLHNTHYSYVSHLPFLTSINQNPVFYLIMKMQLRFIRVLISAIYVVCCRTCPCVTGLTLKTTVVTIRTTCFNIQ